MLHRYLQYCRRNLLGYRPDGVGTSKNKAEIPWVSERSAYVLMLTTCIFIPEAITVTHVVIVNIDVNDGYENVPILQVGPGATIHEASMS